MCEIHTRLDLRHSLYVLRFYIAHPWNLENCCIIEIGILPGGWSRAPFSEPVLLWQEAEKHQQIGWLELKERSGAVPVLVQSCSC